MSGRIATTGDVVRVLVVGDSPRIETAADALASGFETASLHRARTVSDARDQLVETEIHCLLCEHRSDGDRSPLEGLTTRVDVDDVPIVALVDDASGERALEAGAADVVSSRTEPAVLAARIRNAAECYQLADRAAAPHHRALLESVDAPIWLLEGDGTVRYANPAVDTTLGYTPDELERTSLERIVHPDDRPSLRETLRSVSGRPLGARETIDLRLGDEEGWSVAELRCVNRLEDPSLEGIVATAIGLAPATTAVEDVRTALDRLESPLFAVGPDWELQWANAAAGGLFDDDPEPGTVVWSLLPDRLRPTVAERLREARATDSVVRFETPAIDDKDGPLVVTACPDADGVTVLVREREVELPRGDASSDERERLALLESTVDALEDGIVVLDDATIELANAALFGMTGAETLVGRDVDELFDDELAATVRDRADSSIVRWMEPVEGRLVDTALPVDVYVAPLRDEAERTLCIVRNRRQSAAGALETAHRAVGTLRDAEATTTVYRTVLEAFRDRTVADLAVWYLVDEDRLRPAAVEAPRPDQSPDLPPVERDASLDRELLEDDGATVADGSGVEAFLRRAEIDAQRVLAVPIGGDGLVVATSPDPMAFQSLERGRDREALETIADAASITLDRLARQRQVRECRRERARLERELTLSDDVTDLERRVLAAESRERLEQRLCEGLVSLADAIDLAWIGRIDAGAETITPRTWAGRDGDVLEGLTIDLQSEGSTARTARRRETTVLDDLDREQASPELDDERERLRDLGVRSALAVPIERGRFQYGTLTAYATEPAAFDERHRRLCTHLAAVAAHAIGALERKQALLADGVVELEVVVRDESDPLVAFVCRLDQSVEIQAVVPQSSGGTTVYCTLAESIDAERLVDDVADLESVRAVGDADATAVELEFGASTVAETVATHGGVVRSVTPVDGRVRLVIDLARTVDVRAFVETLEQGHPGTELVARREREGSVRPARPFDAQLRERLSERQLRTLESAYYGGFFAWPRESTGEEIAETLGVSQPTFSRHLRLAQGKLFELLFEERSVGLE